MPMRVQGCDTMAKEANDDDAGVESQRLVRSHESSAPTHSGVRLHFPGPPITQSSLESQSH